MRAALWAIGMFASLSSPAIAGPKEEAFSRAGKRDGERVVRPPSIMASMIGRYQKNDLAVDAPQTQGDKRREQYRLDQGMLPDDGRDDQRDRWHDDRRHHQRPQDEEHDRGS